MKNIEILEEQLNYWKDLIKTTEISNPIYTWIKDDKIEQKIIALENLIQENKKLQNVYNKLYDFIGFDLGTIANLENLIKENAENKKDKEKYYIPKSKVKELEEYANWHIEHLTEDIADYIDDDKKGNASIIGEFKEEREHWRDILRIMNNEKTYIDYKNY